MAAEKPTTTLTKAAGAIAGRPASVQITFLVLVFLLICLAATADWRSAHAAYLRSVAAPPVIIDPPPPGSPPDPGTP